MIDPQLCVPRDTCLPFACDPWHMDPEHAQAWVDGRYSVQAGDRLLAWLAVLALPFLAWALATRSIPKGPMRARRAAAALGPAAGTLGGLLLGLEAIVRLPMPPGAFARLIELVRGTFVWVEPSADFPKMQLCIAPPIAPGQTVLAFAGLSGLALLVLAPLFARGEGRREDAFRVAGGLPAAVLLGIAAISVPVLLVPGLDLASFQARFLDWAGGLPIVCMALAIWTQARRDGPPKKEAAPAEPPKAPEVPALDPVTLWKQMGALGPNAAAFFGCPKRDEAPTAQGPVEHVWKAAGGVRSPPVALDRVVEIAAMPDRGAFVADLPRGVEDRLLAAAILHATAVKGTTCLVVVDDVVKGADGRAISALRERVRAALKASGYWEPGPMPLGYAELSETLTGKRLPAVAFLEVDELSEKTISALWGAADANGLAWARHLELVVVPRIDQGSPLRIAHRFWTLRRLGLALRAAGASWSAISTGYGGDETYALVLGAFAAYIRTDRIDVDMRSGDETSAWWVDPEWAAQGPEPWPIRAAMPIARGGLTVAVDDPLGYVDDSGVRARAPSVHVSRALTFDGIASVAPLEGAWLFAAIRSLPYRMPSLESSTHHALFSIDSSPTTRFALAPQSLTALVNQGRLPAPAPLVAWRNPVVQALHLRAALAEGEQDIESLRAVFDDKHMVETACAKLRRGAHALRGNIEKGDFQRVEIVARSGERVPADLRETVTENVVRIVEFDSGSEVARTDEVTVGTRYYPGRVFAKGARRYEVPLGERPRGDLRVRQVDASRPLTRSRLAIELDSATVEHKADLELRLAGAGPRGSATRLLLATLRVRMTESVHGVATDDGKIVQRFAPVRSVFETRVQLVAFRRVASSNVLLHLAGAVEDVLRYMVASDREDFAVVPTDGIGLLPEPLPGIVVVDRQIQSAGVVEALPAARLLTVLEWVHPILAQCTCGDGCEKCTSRRALDAGADKMGVLSLLSA